VTLEASIKTALNPIVAIGGPAAARISVGMLAQPQTLPAVTFFRVDTVFEYAHDGDSELIHPRFQISCWATTSAAVVSLARSVQTAMDTFAAGKALPQDQRDLTDPDTGIHQVALDYIIWWHTT
jgi:hypothetical protein